MANFVTDCGRHRVLKIAPDVKKWFPFTEYVNVFQKELMTVN
jgi:hypothetical protein